MMRQEVPILLINKIKFKTSMLRSSWCDYSDAYIVFKGNITVNNTSGVGAAANNTNKKVIFKNCAPFTNCISKINNTQIDNAEYIDIVMPMYNLIEYSDNYSKTSGSLWQYCKEISAVNNNGNILDFDGANATDSFNFKTKITGQTADNSNDGNIAGRVDVEIMVPLKYLSNFWRTLEIKKQRWKGDKTTPFSKKYFNMMSSTVLLQLNFYLQKFIFYNAKINYSNH